MAATGEHYRLYGLDQHGQRVTAEWIQAVADDEAVAFATAMKKTCRCELWQQDRLVATIGPDPNGVSRVRFPPIPVTRSLESAFDPKRTLASPP
jgi:hypothetical protein